MKKHILLLLILLILALTLTGCKTYEDTNGPDDLSLQTLTEENILRGGSCTKVGSVETVANDLHTVRTKTLNGVDTLETFSGSGSYTIQLSSEITNGNARLVLCTGDRILHDFGLNSENQSWTFTVGHSNVYLRIAGESCGFSLKYRYSWN